MKNCLKWMVAHKMLTILFLIFLLLAYPTAWLLGGGGEEEPRSAHFSPGGKYVVRYYYPARFYSLYCEYPLYIRLYRISDGKMLYESQTEDFALAGAPISWGNESDVRKPLQIHIGMDIWVPFTLPPEK